MDLKALDEFVNLPDPHYNYTILWREDSPFVTFGVYLASINMTSQKWMDEGFEAKPECLAQETEKKNQYPCVPKELQKGNTK
uniref:Uncharacterized protein n=1 Tax=Sphaerodactylus townsendi TaxID=933632 RepID=A0ACB8FHA2_9SAUR